MTCYARGFHFDSVFGAEGDYGIGRAARLGHGLDP